MGLKALLYLNNPPIIWRNKKEKIDFLEAKGLNWFEISEVLDISYDEVRNTAMGDD